MVSQYLDEAGFADAGLPAEHDHLPHPVLDLFPAIQEERDFGSPPNKGGETAGRGNLKAGVPSTLPKDPIEGQPLLPSYRELLIQCLTRKIALDQVMGPCTDHDRIRHRTLLGTFGYSQRHARCRQRTRRHVLLLLNDYLPGVDANADCEVCAAYLLPGQHELLHRLNQLQSSTHGPLGRIFVGHRDSQSRRGDHRCHTVRYSHRSAG